MIKALAKLRLLFNVGLLNVFRVAFYRAALKVPLSNIRRISAEKPVGEFYSPADFVQVKNCSYIDVSKISIFGTGSIDCNGAVPKWYSCQISERKISLVEKDWWQISDFDAEIGDIKVVWEVSRFSWVLAFSQGYVLGDHAALIRLNTWLNDWLIHNPPYKGPNWKCGQEASIRVMHLAMASLLLRQSERPARALLNMISVHLARIAPTISYAIAQDNNHGTSEAAALFIGGSWLARQNVADGKRWEKLGRKWLEERAARLISADGSFSQYSLNYHRVMLDTFCMVEVWRRHMRLPPFSTRWYERSFAASEWLWVMINPLTGDGPNIGANDGAHLLQLSATDYRDFRPSVQLAMALFANVRAYSIDGPWNVPLSWLDVELPKKSAPDLPSRLFDNGGFAVLRKGSIMVMLRYPHFKFRPSQADALHLDLWIGSRNLLRDAGTYSYNTDNQWLDYFPGTASHNTVQFDGRDQMPRLSRFLFGDWLKTSHIEPLSEAADTISFGVAYRDGRKASHQRNVCLSDNMLRVVDKVDGFSSKAILRWRLEPGQWRLEGSSLSNGEYTLSIQASMPIARFALTEGWESRYYLSKEKIPVLEVEVNQAGSLITEFRWAL